MTSVLIIWMLCAGVLGQAASLSGRWERVPAVTDARDADIPGVVPDAPQLDLVDEDFAVHVGRDSARRTFRSDGAPADGTVERVDGTLVLRWTERIALPSGTADVSYVVRLMRQPDGTLEVTTEVQQQVTTVRRSARYRRSDV